MRETDEIKKYSGWKKIELLDNTDKKFYFQSPFGDLVEMNNIARCYTGGSGEYIVAAGENKYYIGSGNETMIYFFAEFDSLKEACEAL